MAKSPATESTSGNFKHTLFEQFARIGKALSNANRLELLEYLAQGERSVDALASVSGLSVANTSQHLQQLRQTGLVASRKDGKTVFYRISDTDVLDLVDRMRRVAERHLAEVEQLVDRYLTVKDELEPVPRRILQQQGGSADKGCKTRFRIACFCYSLLEVLVFGG